MKSKNGFDGHEKYLLRDMIFITGLPKENMNEVWMKSKVGLG